MVCDNRFPASHLIETFVWWLEQSWDLFALSQQATACDNKLQVAVRNDMRLQYYSVLQSTTPVLLCTIQSTTPVLLRTTQHYSSTTLYYTVLLQYYSVLQSTTPVLLCTTKYYSSTRKYYSSTTLYYKVLLQYYSVLHSATLVLLCTTKYYSSTSLMIDPHHLWNFIYNARNNRGASTKSPTAAPATENDSHDWSASHMKR